MHVALCEGGGAPTRRALSEPTKARTARGPWPRNSPRRVRAS